MAGVTQSPAGRVEVPPSTAHRLLHRCFACEACKLIVEVDGRQHDEQEDYDTQRDQLLVELGWRVMRIYAGDVTKDVDNVLRSILGEARPSP